MTEQVLKDGRFVVLGALGEGAQGRTFDGFDRLQGRPVAIKRFDVRGAATWKDVELAEREARVLASLSHPRLPRYVDHFEEDGALYLVMEKIEGASLAALRARGETLSENDVLRLLNDASEVLDYLHRRVPPVIHRDLKPGNVIRRPDGSFAFVDFGAVRDKLRPEGGSTVVGTFGYMAPEQFQGRALPASDVYAVGATALSMLTGRQPEDLPHKGLAIDVRAALRGRSGRLAGVLEAMLAPDPDARAARIAPLLEGPAPRGRASTPAHSGRVDWRTVRDAERAEWRSARDARRWARHEARLARSRARRHFGLPFPFSVVFALAFTGAIVAVAIVTQVAVPLVLWVLSILFGSALRRAARDVRAGGQRALENMERSRTWLRGEEPPSRREAAPRARVDDEAAAPAVRIAPEEGPEEDEREDEERSGRRRL